MHSGPWNDSKELIDAFRKGDKRAFEQIYYQCNKAMFLAAHRIVNDPSDANGIVTECFIRFWEKRENFTGVENLQAYLVKMAGNLARDHYRKNKRHGMAEDDVAYLTDTFEDPAVQEALIIKSRLVDNVLAEMKEMPDKMKTIFKLFYIQGMKSSEISEKLNISMDTVRVQKHRAIQLLKGIFRWKEPPDE